jgi:quinohemoprotein ethanol dehydrogenase
MSCKRAIVIAAAVCMGCAVLHAAAAAASGSRRTAAAGADWYTHGGSDSEANYSALAQITGDNIGRLGLAWSLDLPGEVSLEATPLAIDGTLYFTGSTSKVYAVDAASGRILWTFDPEIYKYRPQSLKLLWGINRGVAYAKGRVFSGTLDGRLLALDAATGKLLWSTKTIADDSMANISGAPWVVEDKVLIGFGGADFGERGYVTAYDQASGKQVWRFYTVPGDPAKGFESPAMKMAAKTWSGQWWKIGGGGGTVWDNMTYDRELHRVYIGVGNSGPWNPRVRSPGGGDNLFLTSIVALDARSGRYIWHYQANPREAWDYKSTANMILAELKIAGSKRKVLMQAPTNGFFYVLDRETGKLISAEKIGKVTWADRIDIESGRPVERPNIRYEKGPVDIYPSPLGAHSWQAMAYDPKAGLVYIPYMQLGARITDEKYPRQETGEPPVHFGGVYIDILHDSPEDGRGALIAWDPVEQQARWRVQHDSFWNGGALATGGEVVFQGTGDGIISGYDARSGARIWTFDAKHGIIAPPISYAVAGKQYVSILVGYGGNVGPISNLTNRGWKFGAQPRRLLTFALDGQARLPPTAPRDYVVHALDDPALAIDPDKAAAGLMVYHSNCAYCHGRLLESAGTPAPDLRESALALEWESFRAVVHDGALLPKLMPKFAELSDEQLRDVYLYIRSGAREVLEQQRSH